MRCAGSCYLGRAITPVEDLRNLGLHLVDTGTSPMSLNAAISGLKFFDITLPARRQLMARMPAGPSARGTAGGARREEVAHLIAACNNL